MRKQQTNAIRRQQSEGTRERILDASEKVVVREGIWSTTTRKIASQASINVATLHYHFDSKEALLFALFESILAAIKVVVRHDYPEATPLAERIESTFLWSWHAMEQHLAEQVLQVELTLYAVRSEGASWLGKRQYDEFVALYVDILRGASEVVGNDSLDIEGLSRFFICGLDGTLLQHMADPDPVRSLALIHKLIYVAQRYPLSNPALPGEPVTALSLLQHPRRTARRSNRRR
ncbi:MAG TPA: TetR/AcrR family transcriptional regulator [Steroidobacteraceae bacterium]|nr:TetR/AcrR family transcriptional regulator [Steroidobacteraceae bacterium]